MKNKIKIVMYLLLIFVLITTIFLEKFAQVFAVDSENSAFQFSSKMENIEENNDAENPEITDPPTEKLLPEIRISRISTTNGDEYIQIANFSQNDIHLDSVGLKLFNSTASVVGDFNLDSGIFAKNSFVLLASSGDDFVKNLPDKTLPNNSGAVKLFLNGEMVDEVCWGSSALCANLTKNLPSIPANMIVQDLEIDDDQESTVILPGNDRFLFAGPAKYLNNGGFTRDENIDKGSPPTVDPNTKNLCNQIKLNEISANSDNQFIEIANVSGLVQDISGCRIMTNRSVNKYFEFPEGSEIYPGKFMAISISETNLQLTKTTSGTVYLLSSDGKTENDAVFYENMSSNTSFANFSDGWKQTYLQTPNEVNIFAQYPPCQTGYFRNSETGRCNKNPEPDEIKICAEGYFLNVETNRCNKNPIANVLAPCDEGSLRNPETGRCKKIASENELNPCEEGWERNPETNRCRKIVSSADANFPVRNSQQSKTSETWLIAGILIIFGMTLVIFWQFREELAKLFAKIRIRLLAKKYYNEMKEILKNDK